MDSSKSRRLNIKSGIIILIVSAALIAVDQIGKVLAVQNLKGRDPIILIDGVFEFHYLENPWAAFSIGKSLNNIFLYVVLILTIAFCCFLIWISFWIPSEKKFWFIRVLVVLFLAGAIGNLIDRIVNHYVIDFLYFVLINFPIFNIADIYVTVGAVLFIVTFLFRSSVYEELFPSKKKKKEEKTDEETLK